MIITNEILHKFKLKYSIKYKKSLFSITFMDFLRAKNSFVYISRYPNHKLVSVYLNGKADTTEFNICTKDSILYKSSPDYYKHLSLNYINNISHWSDIDDCSVYDYTCENGVMIE